MKFYLVNPKAPPGFGAWNYAAEVALRKANTPPLGLLVIAAMIPREHDVVFCDENASQVDLDADCDIVCLTGIHHQKQRVKHLAAEFRKRGRLVVMGGPSVMALPEEYKDDVDIRIVGEAERIWPECLKDIFAGTHKPVYTEEEKIDVALSPVPRYELVNWKHYMNAPVQTTRGCPYLCEFCDIISLYGRNPRVKPVENVLREIELLMSLGVKHIQFVDDNLIGDPRYTKKLLRAIIDYKKTSGKEFTFNCQITINLARSRELLELFRDARCTSACIGIETPRLDSLKETGKAQNLRYDMLTDIRTIRSYGVMIQSGMIVGFDHDDPTIFHQQFEFNQLANIPTPIPSMLGALPGTPLFKRLSQEGRLHTDFTSLSQGTNVIPIHMTRQQLYEGFAWLHEEMFSPKNYTRRILGEIKELELGSMPPERYSTIFLLTALVWIFFKFLFDRQRRLLIETWLRAVPMILTRHPRSIQSLVDYMVRYRQVARITEQVRQDCFREFGKATSRWIPPTYQEPASTAIPAADNQQRITSSAA